LCSLRRSFAHCRDPLLSKPPSPRGKRLRLFFPCLFLLGVTEKPFFSGPPSTLRPFVSNSASFFLLIAPSHGSFFTTYFFPFGLWFPPQTLACAGPLKPPFFAFCGFPLVFSRVLGFLGTKTGGPSVGFTFFLLPFNWFLEFSFWFAGFFRNSAQYPSFFCFRISAPLIFGPFSFFGLDGCHYHTTTPQRDFLPLFLFLI